MAGARVTYDRDPMGGWACVIWELSQHAADKSTSDTLYMNGTRLLGLAVSWDKNFLSHPKIWKNGHHTMALQMKSIFRNPCTRKYKLSYWGSKRSKNRPKHKPRCKLSKVSTTAASFTFLLIFALGKVSFPILELENLLFRGQKSEENYFSEGKKEKRSIRQTWHWKNSWNGKKVMCSC